MNFLCANIFAKIYFQRSEKLLFCLKKHKEIKMLLILMNKCIVYKDKCVVG